MNGDGEGPTTFDTDIATIRACETPNDLIAVVNKVLMRAHECSAAVRQLHGALPIQSVSAIVTWVQRLKSAAATQTSDDAANIYPALYGALRAAVRRMEAIDGGRGSAEDY